MIQCIPATKDYLINSMVNTFSRTRVIIPLIKILLAEECGELPKEVQNQKHTLFRGQSVATKMAGIYLRMFISHYQKKRFKKTKDQLQTELGLNTCEGFYVTY